MVRNLTRASRITLTSVANITPPPQQKIGTEKTMSLIGGGGGTEALPWASTNHGLALTNSIAEIGEATLKKVDDEVI